MLAGELPEGWGLPEMDNASANREHKSQTSLVPGGGSVEAPPRGLRLVQVRTLAGADLKGWLVGPEPGEPGWSWSTWLRTGPDARRYRTRGQDGSQAWTWAGR